MLVKLLPDQVARHWEIIRRSIEESDFSLPGESKEKMNNMLEEFLVGKRQAWISYNSEKVVNGVVTTQIQEDKIAEIKSVLIYSVYSFGEADMKDWYEGFRALKKFAKGEGCSYFYAFSNNDFIIDISNRLGGDTSRRLVLIPV